MNADTDQYLTESVSLTNSFASESTSDQLSPAAFPHPYVKTFPLDSNTEEECVGAPEHSTEALECFSRESEDAPNG